jgi:hypothetical protein
LVAIHPVQNGDRHRIGPTKWNHGRKQTDAAGEAWLQGNPLKVDTYKEEERDKWRVLVAR